MRNDDRSGLSADFGAMANLLSRVRLRIVLEEVQTHAESPRTVSDEGSVSDRRLLLRVGEVAELLSISRTKVYELVASGQIPSLHLGRSRRIPLVALRTWVDEQVASIAQVPADSSANRLPTRIRTVTRTHPTTSGGNKQNGLRRRKASEDAPVFQPWMPHPMKKDEYRAWVAHLEAHPEEKARVIEAMERSSASRPIRE